MALYTELPVFKKTYTLLLELLNTCGGLQKAVKYTLGERVQKEAIEVVINIYKSNSVVDKTAYLAVAREHLETLRLLIRVLHDTKNISPRRLLYLNTFVEDISKQLTGWQKHNNAPRN